MMSRPPSLIVVIVAASLATAIYLGVECARRPEANRNHQRTRRFLVDIRSLHNRGHWVLAVDASLRAATIAATYS